MKERIALGNMKVSDVRNLIIQQADTVSPKATIIEVLKKINENPCTRHVYVVDDDQHILLGSIRMNAIVKHLFPMATFVEEGVNVKHEELFSFHATSANDIMDKQPEFVYENTELTDVAANMMRCKINELPVIDHKKHIIGQINMYDMIRAYLAQF